MSRRIPEPRPIPGVTKGWIIPVPVPYSPITFTHTFVLSSHEGLLLIDPGPDTEETKTVLKTGMDAHDLSLSNVRGVLVTHFHFDHYGLAPWIRQTYGAWIALGAADSSILSSRRDEIGSAGDTWLQTLGVPGEELETIGASWRERARVGQELPDVLLQGHERYGTLDGSITPIPTPGHTPGHMCFYLEEQGVLFSGDHVLPRITPNIAVNPDSNGNPLNDYLASLAMVRRLGNPYALPAHIGMIDDLDERLDQIEAHHDSRLHEHVGIIETSPSTGWQVASRMSWSSCWATMDSVKRRQALGETHAHLVYLEQRGVLEASGLNPIIWDISR